MKHAVFYLVFLLSLFSLNAAASGSIWGNDSHENSGGGIWGNSGYGSDIFNKPTDNGELPEDNSSDYLMNGGNEPVPANDGLYVLLTCAMAYVVYISVSKGKKRTDNNFK